MLTRKELVLGLHTTLGWSGRKNQQNKTDKFYSVFEVMYGIVNSPKDKGKTLKELNLREIIPRGFDARIKESQEQYRQAVTSHDNLIQAIQH